MNENVISIQNPSKLGFKNNHLVIKNDLIGEKEIPFSSISSLLIDNNKCSISTKLLNELAKKSISVFICNEKGLPKTTLYQNLASPCLTKNIYNQIEWTDDNKNKIWKNIVINKVKNQLALLKYLNINHSIFLQKIAPGDPKNVEGTIARIYFKKLFGNNFSRDDCKNKVNAILNYGYVLLTNTIASYVSSHGYLNQIGIRHINRSNCINFACDLVEPFRPIIDLIAHLHQ